MILSVVSKLDGTTKSCSIMLFDTRVQVVAYNEQAQVLLGTETPQEWRPRVPLGPLAAPHEGGDETGI